MSQFKSGDIALTLVERCGIPAMSQVEIQIFVPAGSILMGIDDRKRKFTMDLWQVTTPLCPLGAIMFQPKELMPLRGDFQPEQQKSREVVE